MGIEQQPHASDERRTVIPNSSVCFPSAASRSSGSIGSNKASFGIFKPRQAPGLRRVIVSMGVSRAKGLPARAMTISSPASARASSEESFAFASAILICTAIAASSVMCSRYGWGTDGQPSWSEFMSSVTLRFATADDVGLLLQLIRELAAYERAPGAVVATEEDLRRHGFGPERRFEALLALVDGEPAGFALFFPDFSTWRGRPGIFLEDLYVREWARGRGVGRRLMARLAAIALERDWPALHFNVLDWNPARGFYQRLGIETRSEWQPYSAAGEILGRSLPRMSATTIEPSARQYLPSSLRWSQL